MSIASPALWALTLAAVLLLMALDFLITRRPHEVSVREAAAWSAFYLALPLGFAGWLWIRFGSGPGGEFLTGYLVEKSLSVDNLFVFMLLLTSFAVPVALQQRVLLFGIVGALALRGGFIAAGAAALQAFSATFLVFGLVLLLTAVKVYREATHGGSRVSVQELRSVRLLRRFFPVTDGYRGTAMLVREGGGRAITPLALVVVAILGADVVFAVDSVPAVYGVTGDPYLVFATNAFALLGLRALYFLLSSLLSRLVHLSHGLAAVLALIGLKLVLHWAHTRWSGVPEVPTALSLGLILGILALVTVTSLLATRGPAAQDDAGQDGAVQDDAAQDDADPADSSGTSPSPAAPRLSTTRVVRASAASSRDRVEEP